MRLLCEPYLLDPRPGGIHVVWHTDSPGVRNVVLLGPAVPEMTVETAVAAATGDVSGGPGWRRVEAVGTPLTRMRSDVTPTPQRPEPTVRRRAVHRQFATVDGLPAGRTAYRVVSVDADGPAAVSDSWTLAPAAAPDAPVRLLLTSDHQLKPMVPANLAKVADTVGVRLDGVLFAGDMANVADRAEDWFDCPSGRAFFASLGGRARHEIAGRVWSGAPLLPHTPIYPTPGNHEVMGRWSDTASLDEQFDDPHPDDWDLTTYSELFPLPADPEGGCRRWSRRIGEVHVSSLFAARIWRPPQPVGRGRYQEATEDLDHPERWGHGQFVFEPVGPGSVQYRWLERQLASPQARSARFRVVMFHHGPHSLGDHCVPPFADPVRQVERDPASGRTTAVRYHYPQADDQLLYGLAPLLEAAGVHLVLNGHSHLWNRFRGPGGVNWLETSNVGNTYGAYDLSSGHRRNAPDGYVGHGNPGGLAPVEPTVAPLTGPDGTALRYLASNHVTVFSVLDSAAGTVRSYRFDTREPDSAAVLFDEFPLG
ncbi:MAG TPA: metallophosphoesterase [Micromonospora sp.]